MEDELAKAVARGSLEQFDQAAARLATDKTISRPRREAAYSHAFRVAIKRDRLAMIKRIHHFHPQPILLAVATNRSDTFFSTTGWLFLHATVETIQWVHDHRADRSCCPSGHKNLCCRCLYEALACLGDRDASRVATWLIKSSPFTRFDRLTNGQSWQNLPEFRHATARSVELIRLVDERERLDESTLRSLLLHASYNRRSSVAVYLLDLIKRETTRTSRRRWLMKSRRAR